MRIRPQTLGVPVCVREFFFLSYGHKFTHRHVYTHNEFDFRKCRNFTARKHTDAYGHKLPEILVKKAKRLDNNELS